MGSTPEVSKLAELRAKTDRQLVGLVSKALEHGLVFARVADAQYTGGDPLRAEDLMAKAERAYAESGMFERVIYGINPDQRTRLEQTRRDLRQQLDRLYERQEPLRRVVCC